ncbi:uncharacterized protein LOC144118999 isoform X2 [Amblyomma americanum]
MKPFVPSPGSTASPYPPTDSHSMRRPPPPGFRPPQGPPKSVWFVASETDCTGTSELRPGPQSASAPLSVPSSLMDPLLSQDIYRVQPASRAGTLPPPRSNFEPELSRYSPTSLNHPPVRDKPKRGAYAMQQPSFSTGCPSPSCTDAPAVQPANRMGTFLPPPSDIEPERSGYSPKSQNHTPLHDGKTQGDYAMPQPRFSSGCPSPSNTDVSPVQPPNRVGTLLPPPNSFEPERSGYYPTSSYHPTLCDQPSQGAYAMPQPRFSTGCSSLSSNDVSPVQPPNRVGILLPLPNSSTFEPERIGNSPTSSHHPPLRGHPTQGDNVMPQPKFYTRSPPS